MKIIDFRHELLPLKDKMFRLALRITLNRAEAEDVTQDILLRVWEQRESLGELRSLEAYVLTAVRNLALDRMAKTDNANVSLDDVQTRRIRQRTASRRGHGAAGKSEAR